MPPKYLWRSHRYCLRYYFDIWEHNAADSRNIAGLYRRHACQVELVSTSQACWRSRLTWPLLPATSVLISERYHSSTGSRIGVMSQVAPRHMRTRLNAPYPPLSRSRFSSVSVRQLRYLCKVRRQLRRGLCQSSSWACFGKTDGGLTKQSQY